MAFAERACKERTAQSSQLLTAIIDDLKLGTIIKLIVTAQQQPQPQQQNNHNCSWVETK